MKISRINIENYKKVRDLSLDIPSGNRVICFVGENGCNKTSIISAIYHQIKRTTQDVSPSDEQDIFFNSTSDCSFSTDVNYCFQEVVLTEDDIEYRSVDGVIKNHRNVSDDVKNNFKSRFKHFSSSRMKNFYYEDWKDPIRKQNIDIVSKNVLLFRPSQRNETPSFEVDPNKASEKSLSGSNNVIGRRKFPFKVISGIEKVESYFIDVLLDHLIDMHNQVPNEPIYNKFMEILSSIDSDFCQISVTKFPHKGIKSKNLPSLASLSSGQSDWLVTAISILVQVIELSSRTGKSSDEIGGIVFIDEVDKNYHPKYQEEFMPWLLKTFPNIQFVITTHSPYLVRSLDSNAVVVKLPDGEVLNHDFGYWSIEEVSNTIFDKDLGFTAKVQSELQEFEKLLRKNDSDAIKTEFLRLSGKSESLERKLNQIIYTLGSPDLIASLYETD
ncbi:AAA family ATPase [Vibrio fluvialis]|nr:AAA family ATPase [Vibrio fluvialis]